MNNQCSKLSNGCFTVHRSTGYFIHKIQKYKIDGESELLLQILPKRQRPLIK